VVRLKEDSLEEVRDLVVSKGFTINLSKGLKGVRIRLVTCSKNLRSSSQVEVQEQDQGEQLNKLLKAKTSW
jgi:hypothetical protein